MWKKIIEFKNAIFAVVAIITVTLSTTAYFDNRFENYVIAAEFKEHTKKFDSYVDYQRLDYLDKRILQLEMTYNCIEATCMPPKMPSLQYEMYDSTLKKRSRLQEKLNINKQEDLKP